jgi:hypothetical protein
MTDIRPSILTTGTQSLRSYEKDGVHRQASPVQAYYRFSFTDLVPAGNELFFEIQEDLQLLSFYIGKPTNVTLNSNSVITVDAYDLSNMTGASAPLLGVTVPALALNLGSLILWEPKFLIVQEGWTLSFSANFNYERIFFYGSSVYIEKQLVGRL